jgi:DNA-directed RNA polymerase subunit M/transcription elongation factor TFIIS
MSSISFFCAVCGQALTAEPAFAGELMECTRCERSVPVPGFPATARESGCVVGVYPPEILSMDIVFLCWGCNARLVVDARLEGRELDCPQCHALVRAPLWSRREKAGTGPGARRIDRPFLTPDEIGFLSGSLSCSPA